MMSLRKRKILNSSVINPEIQSKHTNDGTENKHNARKSKCRRKPKLEKVAVSNQFVENDDSDASVNPSSSEPPKKKVHPVMDNTANTEPQNIDATKIVTPVVFFESSLEPSKKKVPPVMHNTANAESQDIDVTERDLPPDVYFETSSQKKGQPVMHYTAYAEPQDIDATERYLSRDVYNKCKDLMWPVMNYLLKLDLKELNDKSHKEKTKFSWYLLKVGIKISQILLSYKDLEKVKEWRRNLWIYVSYFTDRNAKQLYRIYRQVKSDPRLPEVKEEGEKIGRKSILDTSNGATLMSADSAISEVENDSDPEYIPWVVSRASHAVTVEIDKQIFMNPRKKSDRSSSVSSEAKGSHALVQNLENMLLTGEDHDVIFKVQDKVFKAHRNMLRARSPVFAAMFRHDSSDSISIDDCEPDAFADFLRYVYTAKMGVLTPARLMALYYAADKYDVPELKETCAKFLKKSLTTTSVCDVITLAKKHADSYLLESAAKFFSKHMEEVMVTAEWQCFIVSNPIQASELFLKSVKADYKKIDEEAVL